MPTLSTPNDKQSRVFISHSSLDKPFVERLAQDLQAANLDVWVDKFEIGLGDSIVEKINAGLRETDYFLLVISKNSVESRWVQAEFQSALYSELSLKVGVVLPLKLDDTPVPALIQDRIYADFRGDYDAGKNKLLEFFRNEDQPVVLGVASGSSCEKLLKALSHKELRRKMDQKLDRNEVGVVWYDTFSSKLDNDCPNKPKLDCIIDLVDRACRQGKLDDVVDSLCYNYAFITNP